MENNMKELSKPLPVEGIQRTDKKDTHKGYNTTGYGYQYAVDRFNDVFQDEWGFEWEIINYLEGEYQSGTKYHEITVKLSIWVKDKQNFRTCVGGHTSIIYSDALKGAITNAFKKTAAFWGVGREAFAGEIDDDAILPDKPENKKYENKTFVKDEAIEYLRLTWTFTPEQQKIYQDLKAKKLAYYKKEGDKFILYMNSRLCEDNYKLLKEMYTTTNEEGKTFEQALELDGNL